MNKQEYIEELRGLYKARKLDELKKRYLFGKWLLDKETRAKIEKVLNIKKPSVDQSVLDFVEETPGWDWTDK